ncbi:heavy-metal-associated domain-containing protein [Flavihumibacter petaseus]|uniref:HMA domain-containing protein n=1 Tax=Flavihumibacter petaseus NBRC 106054 TaxID=1220578 RepID=A0A0E9N0Y8_9BACT|nr:heavy metal-associated domain-containing protein [Flavihumibacter petaseus]GAO43423.1 hypothetical protein FPE01S_02_05280 [Flavihumibacter petaseus NBRC 106054]
MKKIMMLWCLLAVAGSAWAQFSSATLQASGLTCAMCTRAINSSLEQLSFVEKVVPEIKTSSFTIVFKKDVTVDPDALRKGVEDAGFSVAKLQLKGDFSGLRVKQDTHQDIGGKMFHFIGVKDQVLTGSAVLTVVDKNFVVAKVFKKYSAETTMPCIQTGKSGQCCQKNGVKEATRIYHVTI